MANERITLEQAQEKSLTSLDIAAERRARLREIMPEAFAGDQVDFEQLKRALGEEVYAGKERYGLTWPGKADCMKVIQAPSIATLKPCREESVNFDTTENLFIEGDNLEVLKLLQKAYFGKVKMIYIDPPYNTGKEFIYPDKYSETLETYLAYTGQIDDEGRRFATDTDAGGRRHARWLNMMYPRLYLARNLLREDGVIFISIDDNEQANLKALCDLVFGEENFVACFLWKKKSTTSNVKDAQVSAQVDYQLCYRKSSEAIIKQRTKTTEQRSYPHKDKEGNYRTAVIEKKDSGSYKRDTMKFPILGHHPREGKRWQIGENTAKNLEEKNRFTWDGEKILLKIYDFEDSDTFSAQPNLLDNHGSSESAAEQANITIFGIPELFDTPKPIELLKFFVEVAANSEDIILDFFSGSSTTAHAVMQLNAEDGGNRKFIMVQLPEKTDPDSEAYKAGFKTIADIGKERIRRAAQKIKDKIAEEQSGKLTLDGTRPLDLGFKVFKLAASNFRIWEGEKALESDDELEQTATLLRMLDEHVDHLSQTSTPEDILYELLLKAGFSLTIPIDKRVMAGKDVYSIEDGAMLICLDKHLNDAVIDAMAATHPIRVICLDEGFQGNDQLKANAVQTFKSRSLHEDSEIVFRTV